jgi:hypothetical protein
MGAADTLTVAPRGVRTGNADAMTVAIVQKTVDAIGEAALEVSSSGHRAADARNNKMAVVTTAITRRRSRVVNAAQAPHPCG